MSNIIKQRPAETGGPVALAVSYLLAQVAGVENEQTVWAIAIVVAFVPAAITWLINQIRAPRG